MYNQQIKEQTQTQQRPELPTVNSHLAYKQIQGM